MLYRGMDRAQLDAAYNNSAAVPERDVIVAYSLNRDRIAKPDPRHSFGAAPTDGRRLNPVTLIEITSPASAGSVTVSSGANPVFGICLSWRRAVELTCR